MTHLRPNVLRMVGIVWYNKEEKLFSKNERILACRSY